MISNIVLNNSPVRTIRSKVALYEGATQLYEWTEKDRVISINIDRVGDETKFFGYGICQRANVHLVDTERELDPSTACCMDIRFSADGTYQEQFPRFFVSQCNRDENTNELSITAYDRIYKAAEYTVADLGLTPPYSPLYFASQITVTLGISGGLALANFDSADVWMTQYEEGANYEGTENLRDALNHLAEITQSIYYINNKNQLCFKRLDRDGDAVLTIDKSRYITLESSTSRRLGKLVHTTELGDNIHVQTAAAGTTQYIRDNPFWNIRDDVEELLQDALDVVGGLTINQFECKWRGHYGLEIGDKLGLTTKDDDTVYAYLLDDHIEYDGAYSQKTLWKYSNSDAESESSPATVGEALKQTYAKVDKINQQIELMVKDVENFPHQIAQIQLSVDDILIKVESLDERDNMILEEMAKLQVFDDSILAEVSRITTDINTITQKIETVITPEKLSIAIKEILSSDGVDSITTATGYTFDADGLTITKTGTEMSTQITEDGMTVYRNKEAVLVADNTGVEATNLHATTYLIIGGISQFEEYIDINNRTRIGCFWLLD